MESYRQEAKNIKKNTKPKFSDCVPSSYSEHSFDDVLEADDARVNWNSKPTRIIEPHYPTAAAKNKTEGYVKASLITDEQGCVINVSIIESYPLGVFDASMIKALKLWRYSPALVDGKPIKIRAVIQFDFKMPKERLKKAEPESKISLDLEKLVAEKMKGV